MGGPLRVVTFSDLDAALEWCENRLIARRSDAWVTPPPVVLAEHEFCRGLERQALAHLEGLLERRRFGQGEYIVRKGDAAEEVYLLMSAEVSVVVTLSDGRLKRMSTLSAGMTFGELAIVGRAARSADVRADKPVECYVLSAAAFARLGDTHPKIKVTLLQNMLRSAYQMVSRLNQEVVTLATIERLQQDMDVIRTLSVWVPLAACSPVRLGHTGSKLPVAPENPHLGMFSP